MPHKAYWATNLGSGTGGIKKIDGAALADLDICYVPIATGVVLTYWLDEDNGATELSPDILAPTNNGGNKRWLRIGISFAQAAVLGTL